ncbi:MAG: protocatechuate 3,4-dioxygenase subunit alpha [Acidobacteriota bacterium]|nr:protocatechuate 3,4-dioxygenase subunit alpha [Acidobacteriota bacterium]
MKGTEVWIADGSQTVGPYFRIGLQYLVERAPTLVPGAEGTVTIRGRVLDRDGAAVPDALLEFWGANAEGKYGSVASGTDFPAGFYRVPTDGLGAFEVTVQRPGVSAAGDGRSQAPHFLVLVFMRGLLRHLLTRVYFAGDESNASDPVLQGTPDERRGTLLAQPVVPGSTLMEWNLVLQGADETVFFAW